jgi:hypothetical protein
VVQKAHQAIGPGCIWNRLSHQSALGLRGELVNYGPFSLWVIHTEGLCPSSGDINRLMMKGLTKLTDIYCDKTVMGLPPIMSAVFLIAHVGKM